MKNTLIVLLALIVPATALAQTPVIEITPSIGYRWGGEITTESTDLLAYDVDVDDREAYGLTINLPLTRRLQLELMHDRQRTELVRDRGLFVPNVDGADVDIDYSHLGLVVQFPGRAVTPYVVASAGLARIAPDLPGARREHRFSAGLGGGVKLAVTDHFGLRLEARHLFTNLGSRERGRHWDCDDHDCFEDLQQGQVKVGFTFSF